MLYPLEVDGRAVTVEAEPSLPLLLALRNDLGLSAPKLGCGLGQCGACTVLIDGEPARSCVRRMSSLEAGASITTAAGLGTAQRPHPVQAAFLAEQALQCGYCTSGMMVAAAALLRARPDPSDAEIRDALGGHLCRCGVHDRILRAVRRAASAGAGPQAALGDAPIGAAAASAVGALALGVVASVSRCWAEAPTRRAVLGGGFLLLGFCVAGRAVLGQPAAPPAPPLPGSLASTRALDAWIRVGADGTVSVLSGKVELGQGIRTALAQIVADELDVAIERMRMEPTDTDHSPDEGYTSGSVSIQQSGAALRQAAAEARAILLELAATRLGVPARELRVDDGRVAASGGARAVTYWELVSAETLRREATGLARPKPVSERRLVGRPVARLDAPGKVFGEAVFVHDLRLPGMLHARVVRPPGYGARLTAVDETAARALPGVVRVVRDGSFLAVIAQREEQAMAAAEALADSARWDGAAALPTSPDPSQPPSSSGALARWLRDAPSRQATVSAKGVESESVVAATTLEADYAKPFIAHASLAPSCAVAREEDGRLHVWTHSQGVFPLRAALAKVLGRPPETLRVTHAEGAGCYGHNGADDAACDAALLARGLDGRPVRVQWSRQDEMRWAPFGSAMAIRMRAGLDASGGVAFWRSELWSHTHSTRPGREAGFVAAWHLASPQPPPVALNIPQPAGGEDRNAVPLYDFASQRVIEHFVPDMPVRVSALRSLGAYANVFAIESFMDELAAAAGVDPLAFRLRHLTDARARDVIERAARAAGWNASATGAASPVAADGLARGSGMAFARYKNQAAYVALVASVAVDRASGTIRLERVVAAVDAGDVVNPDGLRNQIEGGIAQASSWTLYEEVAFDRDRITSVDWRGYPIAGFADAPTIAVEVVDRPDQPPVGAGEAAQGPTAAAIANAVSTATGVRLRELPLRADRVKRSFAAADGVESAR